MPEIALTGASGHLGFVIQKMLVRDSVPHRLLLRRKFDYLDHNEMVMGDLEEPESRSRLVKGCRTVIHCAGKVWPKSGPNRAVIQVNYELTKRLFEDSVRAGVEHFIYISSIHSMETPPGGTAFDETAQLVTSRNRSYDFSKAMAEKFLKERTEIRITILNPTAIIGPGDHYLNGLNQLFDRLYRQKLPVLFSGGFDVVDVRDVANAALTICRNRQEGKFILSGRYHSLVQLAKMFAKASGKKAPAHVIGPKMMHLLAALSWPVDRLSRKPIAVSDYSIETLLTAHEGISSEKAHRLLGYVPRDLEQTMQDLVEWVNYKRIIL